MKIPILPISTFDENRQTKAVYVNNFQDHLEKHHKDILKPHAHDFFICVLFTAGFGTHTIDFNSYPIHPGALFFMQPKNVHEWTFDSDVEGWIFFHSETFYQTHQMNNRIHEWPFYQSTNTYPYIQLSEVAFTLLSKYFNEMYLEYSDLSAYSYCKIAALQQLIYIDAAREYLKKYVAKQSISKRFVQTYLTFEQLIEIHYIQEKSPSFYAEKLAISTKHLHRICSAINGTNPTKVIAERVILEAKRMLVISNLQLQEIANRLGFESYPYFNRFFKKHCGFPPSNFVSNNR